MSIPPIETNLPLDTTSMSEQSHLAEIPFHRLAPRVRSHRARVYDLETCL